jgi:hypothetical protein
MVRNKPQVTRPQKPSEVQLSDLFETPNYAVTPLLPYLKRFDLIWEPASGSGRIQSYIVEQNIANVIGTDLKYGNNFFDYELETTWDAIVTNPPYSIKFKWLERCYTLGKPFALLVPLETIGALSAQVLLEKYGFEMMLLNSRVDFFTPNKGWDGKGSQFPCIWLTWNILPEKIIFADIKDEKAEFKKSLKEIKNA